MSDQPRQAAVLDPSPQSGPPHLRTGTGRNLRAWLGRAVPPFVVFAALGGLLVWGHHTGWTIPKFAALVGPTDDANDDWCGEHGVPQSQCVECNPGLLPRPLSFGWCKVHGVHECPLCHPEIAQIRNPPEVTVADMTRAQRALDLAERPRNNGKCKLHERRLQLASSQTVEKVGIKEAAAYLAPILETVSANGEITYDQTRTARLSVRVPGTVFRVCKQVGAPVKQGDVLALIDAAEVGKVKSEFLQAVVQLRLRAETMARFDEAYKQGALAERAYRDQAAILSEARIRLTTAQEAMTNLGLPVDVDSLQSVPQERLADRLRFLGLPPSLTAALDARTTTGNLLAVTAPFDGVVVTRQVVDGEVVDSSKVLFVVVDIRQMWLTLDLRVEDAPRVVLGQDVRCLPDGSKQATGRITWISTEADRKTRTIKVRAELDNRAGGLRANTFTIAKVVLREERQAVVVPSSAVHWEGCCHVVFVYDRDFFKDGAAKVFHVRTVRLGASDEQNTEIIAGLLPGELVAAAGSGVLRTELLRANLGEGCACH
jgi:membrane fusion protein, heavy metal efflux system